VSLRCLFQVFSETPVTEKQNGGCVNFITAAGGLLQSIVFGYGGIRIRKHQLDINPYLLPETTSWRIFGLHYRDAIFDLLIEQDSATITLTKAPASAAVMYMKLAGEQTARGLSINKAYKFKRQQATLSLVHVTRTKSKATGTEPTFALAFALLVCVKLLIV